MLRFTQVAVAAWHRVSVTPAPWTLAATPCRSRRGYFKRCLASFLVVGSISVSAFQGNHLGIYRKPGPDYDSSPREQLLQPGNKALVDDHWIDTGVGTSTDAVTGDWFSVTWTDPTGAIDGVHRVDRNGVCWYASFATYCGQTVSWYLGHRIYNARPGLWTMALTVNGTVIANDSFTLVGYDLQKYSGDGQSIRTLSTTPQPLSVRFMRPDGNPGVGKPVTFAVTSKPGGANPPGGLSSVGTYTNSSSASLITNSDANGIARVHLDTGSKAGTYTVTATSPLSPGRTIVFTVVASNTDPTDSANREKGLGVDPAANTGCAAATRASTDNPISISSGNKYRQETDYEGAGVFPLYFARYYNSAAPRGANLGPNWRGWYDRSILVSSAAAKGKTTTVAEAVRPDGKTLKFTLSGGNWVGEPDVVDRLVNTPGGGYRFICANDSTEEYTSSGKLLSIAAREGFAHLLVYDSQGRPSGVTDAFGRTLAFAYDADGRLVRMLDPAGQPTLFTYDAAGNLAGVQYPDATTRRYHYEDPGFPRALTGITDENQARYATFAYDRQGRAVASELAGGSARATVYYNTDGSRDVVDAAGNTRRYRFSVIQGVARRTSLDNGACAACGNASTLTGYTSSGFVSSMTDYNGTQTTFVRDTRGLETSRTEAVGTTEARGVTTAWHPSLRLPLSIARPGRRTEFTYDAAGRILTQTETDTATGAARRWTMTYNGQGLVATIDGPRTDVSDITSFNYDAKGNLSTRTDAAGHVTRFTAFDAHGRVLSITDPNGLVTIFGYDLRGRLTSRNAGGRTTLFTYTPAGQLARVTQPDGSWVERQYNAAQQFVGTLDSAGQRRAYSIDGNGRPVREEHFDAAGQSMYVRGWSLDPLGRVVAETDAHGAVQWRHRYDGNGNLVSSTDALGQANVKSYDALNRLRSTTDPLGAVTRYGWDARDNLLSVTDPLGIQTQYSYDGLDNLTREASPDAGISTYGYDPAGNLRSRTWANGRGVYYSLDALNRVVREDYGSGVQVSYGYDEGVNAVGRLSSALDSSGSNAWSYDPWGAVVQTVRTTGSRSLVTGHSYDTAGRLSGLTYPSGRTLSYSYDVLGRIAAIIVDGQVLVDSIAWLPHGVPSGWRQGNGRTVRRLYDRDGRLTMHDLDVGTRTLYYDPKGRVALTREPWGDRTFRYDGADRLTSEAAWSGTWSYTWDANGNRLSQATPWGSTSYGYQAGTNRIASAAGMDARFFSHDSVGNVVAEGGYTYGYDARNRLASAAGAGYSYDALGRRVRKVAQDAVRYYAHDEQRHTIGEYDDAGIVGETVWLGNTPVAHLRAGKTYWTDVDHLNTPRALRNAADQIVWRWRSEAFGAQAAEEDPSGLGVFEFNLRLPGQWFDQESALHHNDQRDYRAHVGRYLQSDPIGLAGGVNTYGYAEGNPISLVDPLGLTTYMCTQPLHALGEKWGPRLYPESRLNPSPFYHQFVCVPDGIGGKSCGGQDRAEGPFGPGKPSTDTYQPDICKAVDERPCVERCLLTEINNPNRPAYALFGGGGRNAGAMNCQQWADKKVQQCQQHCTAK